MKHTILIVFLFCITGAGMAQESELKTLVNNFFQAMYRQDTGRFTHILCSGGKSFYVFV
jgi:hypothetical protein